MILGLFRRKESDAVVERLYEQIVAAARQPVFFSPERGAPDTVEGRFEVLALHALLVLRRLSALPAPAPDLAQDLADRIFEGFDAALREMGVGDLGVPKRMKRLAEDFGGRCEAYTRALDGAEPLAAAVARNVFGSGDPARGRRLAEWVLAAERSLASADLVHFEAGLPPLPALTGDGENAP